MRSLLLAALIAIALLPAAPAHGDACGSSCRVEGAALDWPKAALRSCIKACRREERKCRKVPRGDRAACREDNADCPGECGQTWADPALAHDRSFCQLVCSSCKRDGRQLCVAGFRTATKVARCCGRPTDAPCCPRPLAFVTECCEPGDTCCPGAGCADTQNDVRNCGACKNQCSEGQSCCAGSCVDTQSDAQHCGSCGHACAANEVCEAGTCVENPCRTPSVLCEVTPAGPTCCSPSDKCCAGGGDRSACQRIDILQVFFPEAAIVGPDDVTCCRHPNPPDGGEVFRSCPNGYPCCFQLEGSRAVMECCRPGRVCDSRYGLCYIPTTSAP